MDRYVVLPEQKGTQPDAAYQPSLRFDPIGPATKPQRFIGDRLNRYIEARQPDLAFRPVADFNLRRTPEKIAGAFERLHLKAADIGDRRPLILPARGNEFDQRHKEVIEIAKHV